MNRRTVVLITVALAISGVVVFGQTAFETVFSDAATRLAYQIRDEAAALRRSGQTTVTFAHHPAAWPNGVDADYRIELDEGYKPPRPGHRSIGVARNLTAPTFYATSYHLSFVEVPHDLAASHRKGEPTMVTLVRDRDTIYLTALK